MKQLISFALLFSASVSAKTQHTGTLLVANKAEHSVSLINLNNSKTVATIPVEYGPHEIAVSPSGKLAAVANYGDGGTTGNSISIIDITAKTKISTISLGDYQRPHGIEFLNEDELFATCEVKMVLIKVHLKTAVISEVAGTAQSGSHMLALARNNNLAYVANVSSGSVSIIDVNNKQLVTVIPLQPGTEGLDVSPDGKELWIANRNDSSVSIINTSTKETVATIHAHSIAFRVKFLPDGKYVLISNAGYGNISVFDAVSRKLIQDIDVTLKPGTPPFPVGLAANTNSQIFYASIAGYNEAFAIDVKTGKIIKRYKTGKEPDGIYYSSFQFH